MESRRGLVAVAESQYQISCKNWPRAPVNVSFVEVFTNAFDSFSTPLSIRLSKRLPMHLIRCQHLCRLSCDSCRAGGQGVHNADWNPKFGL
jgi:hypothetical protein